MLKAHAVVLLAATLALGGCDITGSETGPGIGAGTFTRAYTSTKSAIGLSSGSEAASAVTNAAFGGLIGAKLGAALNDEDRRLAYEAQIVALDRGAPGAPVPWRNAVSGRFGNIVAGPLYEQKGAQCRGFSHTITVGTELKTARGTACRSPEGGWAAAG
ncbi:MAG: LipA a lipoprotein [Tardiphaga sp.]|jgi:surface antigen|uniref:RT0821/Lpp0805 family surface protein n=1 Tax=Tardiphaga sp. TaxID=1926292 RepID=UPI00262427D5|nr:RT0821/Lpp0805 family surface protein [Tardiphaga sp.]MDB5502808.1 LipA a lipoprotein [Tardiphaga sp.]